PIDCNDNDRYERPYQIWFGDPDNDGYVDRRFFDGGLPREEQCFRPEGNWVSNDELIENGHYINNVLTLLDCNANDPMEHPNQTWYPDIDNDGFIGSTFLFYVQCTRPANH